MIRPWYRSRLCWAGIPGLLFLLWVWWDSGAHTTFLTASGPGGSPSLNADIQSGGLRVQWHPGSGLPGGGSPVGGSPVGGSPGGGWTFSGDRWPLGPDDPAAAPGTARPRQFDVAQALRLEKEMDGLGKNPAAAGWVPSPGHKLPVSKLVRIEGEVAWWTLVLGYLLAMTLLLACWQYRKARREERRGGPRAVISFRPWLPFVALLCLTGCFFDSFQTRSRGWLGNRTYHVGWSHHRGLLTASFFHRPPGPTRGIGFIREPRGRESGGLTSRRWPLWIGAEDTLTANSRELRLPTTFTLGVYVSVWLAAACWRWQRHRARLRKLSPSSPEHCQGSPGDPTIPEMAQPPPTKPKPRYRSWALWVGLLGLLLLVVAWWQPFAKAQGRTWAWTHSGGRSFYVSSGGGLVTLGSYRYTATRYVPAPPLGLKYSLWAVADQEGNPWFPPVNFEFLPDTKGGALRLCYWFVVAAYLATWLPWWWARHGRRRARPPRFPGTMRPWFGSPLLWAGVPGAVLLVWVWVDSTRHRSYIDWSWATPGGKYIGGGMESVSGQLAGWVGKPYRGSPGMRCFRQPRVVTATAPAATATATPKPEKGKRRFRFGYLPATAAYGVVWLGLFAGIEVWLRRRTRARWDAITGDRLQDR